MERQLSTSARHRKRGIQWERFAMQSSTPGTPPKAEGIGCLRQPRHAVGAVGFFVGMIGTTGCSRKSAGSLQRVYANFRNLPIHRNATCGGCLPFTHPRHQPRLVASICRPLRGLAWCEIRARSNTVHLGNESIPAGDAEDSRGQRPRMPVTLNRGRTPQGSNHRNLAGTTPSGSVAKPGHGSQGRCPWLFLRIPCGDLRPLFVMVHFILSEPYWG